MGSRPGARRAAGREVIGLDCGRDLYTASGRRRIMPPLRFGLAVLHLLRHRGRYDIVHTCSFPYFPLLSCAAVRALGGPPIVTDWIEVWSDEYWQRYLGQTRRRIGAAVQNLCIGSDQQCVHAFRAGGERAARRMAIENRSGGSEGTLDHHPSRPSSDAPPGTGLRFRRPAHSRKTCGQDSGARSRSRARQIPELRAKIFGDGPERAKSSPKSTRLHLGDVVECPGFVPWAAARSLDGRAIGLILPSEREGYGSVVIEAIARGTPAIVVRGPDNAATDLIVENVNGFVAPSADASVLADHMVKFYMAGPGAP